MTCRFELEFQELPYPRSCPTCGISGKCVNGYEQIKHPAGGYSIRCPDGKTDPYAGRQFVEDVLRELDAARLKFPSSVCCLAALHEESGELAQAVLKNAAGKWPASRIYEEAVQVAVMAMRVALEGDPSITAASYTEPGE